jgi:hypothetical protein
LSKFPLVAEQCNRCQAAYALFDRVLLEHMDLGFFNSCCSKGV